MKQSKGNIYKNARRAAGFTQERWAEILGLSVESIRLYETGRCLPSDETAINMADLSGIGLLALWHLKEKSAIANDMLPELETVELPQAVIQLLCQLRDFKASTDELLTIAADGYVSEDERGVFDEILETLDGIIKAAWQVKFTRKGGRNDDRP